MQKLCFQRTQGDHLLTFDLPTLIYMGFVLEVYMALDKVLQKTKLEPSLLSTWYEHFSVSSGAMVYWCDSSPKVLGILAC